MSPDTIEAVRCALMTVGETGGTMDELALVEQADTISELTLKLAELKAELVELREVYRCAKGLCVGEDWNGGIAAFYYRKPLRKAVVKAGLQEKGE